MKDFAFMFMPGDYLRDTQCLSEKTQVAYDRIMCEHMRNICITQAQLNFFTKRLSEDEKSELEMVLSKDSDGYFIEWVRDSINKRKAYSESRRKNREQKSDKDMLSHDHHMEYEDDNKDEDVNIIINNEAHLLNEWSKQYFHTKYINKTSLDAFDKLIRIDKYTVEDIKKAIIWARSDDFWTKNFLSPVKLRNKDKSGVKYIDVFLAKTLKISKHDETAQYITNRLNGNC